MRGEGKRLRGLLGDSLGEEGGWPSSCRATWSSSGRPGHPTASAFKCGFYLLTKLENSCHAKDPPDYPSGNFSIEHIMPQNARSSVEWREMLRAAASVRTRSSSTHCAISRSQRLTPSCPMHSLRRRRRISKVALIGITWQSPRGRTTWTRRTREPSALAPSDWRNAPSGFDRFRS